MYYILLCDKCTATIWWKSNRKYIIIMVHDEDMSCIHASKKPSICQTVSMTSVSKKNETLDICPIWFLVLNTKLDKSGVVISFCQCFIPIKREHCFGLLIKSANIYSMPLFLVLFESAKINKLFFINILL